MLLFSLMRIVTEYFIFYSLNVSFLRFTIIIGGKEMFRFIPNVPSVGKAVDPLTVLQVTKEQCYVISTDLQVTNEQSYLR